MLIILIGAQGQLGLQLVRLFKIFQINCIILTRKELDITNFKQVISVFSAIFTDNLTVKRKIILNCAAFTDVDLAETQTELAYQVNQIAISYLVEVANRFQAKLIHISTDYIFDGNTTNPYDIYDSPNPIQVYGASKLAGEKIILNQCLDYVIVRTSLLFTGNLTGTDFVARMYRSITKGNTIAVVDDLRTNPTWTPHLAKGLLELLQADTVTGILHVSNQGSCTRYGLLEFLCSNLRRLDKLVSAQLTDFSNLAARPKYSVLDLSSWTAANLTALPSWHNAILELLAETVE